jgi:hypothetical protein
MQSSSRRAAQWGLGAAILLLITCVTLIISASSHAGAYTPPTPQIETVQ